MSIFAKIFWFLLVGTYSIFALAADSCEQKSVMWPCPPNWEFWGNACYRLTGRASSWNALQSDCSGMGGELLAPLSAEENEAIVEMAKGKGQSNFVWIGCRFGDDLKFGCDGQQNSAPLWNWYPGQPNEGEGMCVLVSVKNGDGLGKWYDWGCHRGTYKAVCVRRGPVVCKLSHDQRCCFSVNDDGQNVKPACLAGRVSREFVTGTVVACGSACIAERTCRSFNVKQTNQGKKLCQLMNGYASTSQNLADVCIFSGVCPD